MKTTITNVLEEIKNKMEARRESMTLEIERYRNQVNEGNLENQGLLTYYTAMRAELFMQIDEIQKAIESVAKKGKKV